MTSCTEMIGKYAFKTAFIAIFVLVATFVARPVFAADDSAQVLQVTTKFYDDYLQRVSTLSDDSEDLVPYLSKRNDVDPSYLERLDKLITEAFEYDEEIGLDYDPILMAQEVPLVMNYGTPVINGTSAEIIANKVWMDEAASPLCVTLTKQDGAWRISDIIDMEDEESQRDCGGMKVD